MDVNLMDISNLSDAGRQGRAPSGHLRRSKRNPLKLAEEEVHTEKAMDDIMSTGDTIASEADSLARLLRTKDQKQAPTSPQSCTDNAQSQPLFNVHSTPARSTVGLLDEDLDLHGSDSSLLLDVDDDRLVDISPQPKPRVPVPVIKMIDHGERVFTPDDDPFSMKQAKSGLVPFAGIEQNVATGLLIDISPLSNSKISRRKSQAECKKLVNDAEEELRENSVDSAEFQGVVTRSRARQLHETASKPSPETTTVNGSASEDSNEIVSVQDPLQIASSDTHASVNLPQDTLSSVVDADPSPLEVTSSSNAASQVKSDPDSEYITSHDPLIPEQSEEIRLLTEDAWKKVTRPTISFKRRQTLVGVVKPQQIEATQMGSEGQSEPRQPVQVTKTKAAPSKPPTGSSKPQSSNLSKPPSGKPRPSRVIQPVSPKVSAVTAKRLSMAGAQKPGITTGRMTAATPQRSTSTVSRLGTQTQTPQMARNTRRQSLLNPSKPVQLPEESTKKPTSRSNRQSLLPSDIKPVSSTRSSATPKPDISNNPSTRTRRQSLLPPKTKPTTPPTSRVSRRQSMMPPPRVATPPRSRRYLAPGTVRPSSSLLKSTGVPSTPGRKDPVTRATRQSLLPPSRVKPGGATPIVSATPHKVPESMANKRRSVSAGRAVPFTPKRSMPADTRSKVTSGTTVGVNSSGVVPTRSLSKRLSTSLPSSAR